MDPGASPASGLGAHIRPLTDQERDWERLVLEYYEPRGADEVRDLDRLHKSLQAVQDSPEGWKFADALLNSTAELAVFHGALVMTIKLNREGVLLQEQALNDIRDLLTTKFLDLVALQAPYRVIQKLCSALVALFVVPLSQWDQCVRHLACLVAGGSVMSYTDINAPGSLPPTHEIVLQPMALAALVIFATTLAEDINKIDHSNQKSSYLAPRLALNFDDIVAILYQALECNGRHIEQWFSLKDAFGSRSFECLSSWITYSQAQLLPGHAFVENLRRLLDGAIPLISNPSLIKIVSGFFSDVITSHRNILLPQQAQHFISLFQSEWAAAFVKDLESGVVNDEITSLVILAFAFGQYTISSLIETTPQGEKYLELLHRLTAAQTIQTVEEDMSNDVLDFWDEFILAIPYESITSDITIMQAPQRHWLRALEELCRTGRLPLEGDDFEHFSFDDPFSDYRTRIAGMVQDTYEIMGHSILEKLVSLALRAYTTALAASNGADSGTVQSQTEAVAALPQQLQHDLWSMLESALHNLYQMSHALDYQLRDQNEDATLDKLFKSEMFGLLLNMSVAMPMRMHTIAFNLIGSFSDYFGHQGQFLLDALDTLFQHLPDPTFSEVAARAIHRLCDKNRRRLTGKIDDFMSFTAQYFSTKQALSTSSKVLAANAAIVQALPEGAKAPYLSQLVSHIERAYGMVTSADGESTPASIAFLQLIEVAECSLTPSNVPVDLEDDESNLAFWSRPESKHFEHLTLRFVDQLLQQNRDDGAALANACKFFVVSLSQTHRGPFCFNPLDVVSIITRTDFDNPRIDSTFCLASALVGSKWWRRCGASARPLLDYALAVLERLEDPDADPDVAVGVIEFFKRTTEFDIGSIIDLSQDMHERIVTFTMATLRDADTFSRREACRFWSAMIKTDSRPADRQEQATNLVRHVGQELTLTLMCNIGGLIPKSELESQCETLRRLVTAIPESKMWIESSMASPRFPSGKSEETDRRRFLLQFTNPMLPKRKASEAVRVLWHACRGIPMQYY